MARMLKDLFAGFITVLVWLRLLFVLALVFLGFQFFLLLAAPDPELDFEGILSSLPQPEAMFAEWIMQILVLAMLATMVMIVFTLLKHILKLMLNPKRTPNRVRLDSETKSKGEKWIVSLGWFFPRKYRDDVIGDILEDCADMREAGCTERRIKFHVLYQWVIAVVTLVPTAVKTSIVDAITKVLSRPN